LYSMMLGVSAIGVSSVNGSESRPERSRMNQPQVTDSAELRKSGIESRAEPPVGLRIPIPGSSRTLESARWREATDEWIRITPCACAAGAANSRASETNEDRIEPPGLRNIP